MRLLWDMAVQDQKRKACLLARDGNSGRVVGAIGTRQKEAQRVTRLLLCIVLKRNAQIITNYRSKERVQKPRMGRKSSLVIPAVRKAVRTARFIGPQRIRSSLHKTGKAVQ